MTSRTNPSAPASAAASASASRRFCSRYRLVASTQTSTVARASTAYPSARSRTLPSWSATETCTRRASRGITTRPTAATPSALLSLRSGWRRCGRGRGRRAREEGDRGPDGHDDGRTRLRTQALDGCARHGEVDGRGIHLVLICDGRHDTSGPVVRVLAPRRRRDGPSDVTCGRDGAERLLLDDPEDDDEVDDRHEQDEPDEDELESSRAPLGVVTVEHRAPPQHRAISRRIQPAHALSPPGSPVCREVR